MEKKKGKKKKNKITGKKKEVPSIELANFDGWSYPLRYSGMNLPRAFTLPFCTPPHAYTPFSMQWWCVDAVVVITRGWCVAKKKGTCIQRTPPPMEKKKE